MAADDAARVVVVPPVPALLAQHASLTDPVPDLRAACAKAVGRLVSWEPRRVVVLADPHDPWAGTVAEALLAAAGHRGEVCAGSAGAAGPEDAVLVLANGTARRSDEAPGGLDPRAADFDRDLEAALTSCDGEALRGLDTGLGEALLASGVRQLRRLGALLSTGGWAARTLYAGDPHGVQYWVVVLSRR